MNPANATVPAVDATIRADVTMIPDADAMIPDASATIPEDAAAPADAAIPVDPSNIAPVDPSNTVEGVPATSEGAAAAALQAAGVPISLSNPNHASLHNILLSMASHGPPVDQWEGNHEGERIFTLLFPRREHRRCIYYMLCLQLTTLLLTTCFFGTGKEGGEKTIQDLKPYFHGVCVVDGGSMSAAFKNYYRCKVIRETNVAVSEASSLVQRGDEASRRRARYTDVNRYNSYEDAKQMIVDVKEFSAYLYHTGPVRDPTAIVCVAVKKSAKQAEVLYRLDLAKVQPVQPFCDDDAMPFARTLLTFATVSMCPKDVARFEPSNGTQDTRLVTTLAFIPGTHVWRDKAYTSFETFETDSKYVVVSDGYSLIENDGVIRQKVGIDKLLWTDFAKDSEEIENDTGNDWMSYLLAQLKEEIASRNKVKEATGLPKLLVSGTKQVLADRLQADDEGVVIEGDNVPGDWSTRGKEELKDEIRRRNVQKVAGGCPRIPLSGNKAALIERLVADDALLSALGGEDDNAV